MSQPQRKSLPATEIRQQEDLVATDPNEKGQTEDQSSQKLTHLYSLVGNFPTGWLVVEQSRLRVCHVNVAATPWIMTFLFAVDNIYSFLGQELGDAQFVLEGFARDVLLLGFSLASLPCYLAAAAQS